MVPDPFPGKLMSRMAWDTSNVALQVLGVSIVTLVVCPLPSQSPLQPTKVDPLAASVINVTTVPAA